MDISELREKPAGRQPIDTRAIPDSRLEEVMDAVGRALAAGKLVYWICPLVEESEAEGTDHLVNATKRFESLKKRFGGQVGLVHGQMKGTEKDRVMAAFASHEIGLLVATTVVEVGVDVPAATIMVIENAERFGLAHLVQRLAARAMCLACGKAACPVTASLVPTYTPSSSARPATRRSVS